MTYLGSAATPPERTDPAAVPPQAAPKALAPAHSTAPHPVPTPSAPPQYIPPNFVSPHPMPTHSVPPHQAAAPEVAAQAAPAEAATPQPAQRSPAGSPRIPSNDKRRNRRRKSKFAKPLLSLAHGLLVVQALLLALFVVAVFQGLSQGSNLQVRSVDAQQLSDLNLPGAETRRRSGIGPLQFAIWIYLFGAPAIFAAQRSVFWARTNTGAQYLTMTIMALWFMVIMVILIAPNISM